MLRSGGKAAGDGQRACSRARGRLDWPVIDEQRRGAAPIRATNNCMSKWILLVEDDKDIQASLLDLLDMEGYSVRAASDGQEALDLLRDTPQLPGLILLDLMMRGMGGQEFRELQLQDPELATIPVVIMSADGEPSNRIADQGIAGYLRKPADVSEILDAVARHARPATAT
jgi:two-component system chemotaxis response regulator CheY